MKLEHVAQATGGGLLAAGAYVVHVWRYPFGWCLRCAGRGKIRSRKGKGRSYRKCTHCKGKGDRIRWAPRLTARARLKARARR